MLSGRQLKAELLDVAPRNMLRLLRGNEMRRQVEPNFSISGSVGTESLPSFLQYAVNLVLAQDDSYNRQPAPKVGFDHGPNAGELRRPAMGGDLGRGHPGFRKQRGQIYPIAEHEWRSQGIGRFPSRQSLQQRHFGRVCGYVVQRVLDRNGQPSPGSQDAKHLAKRLAAVREEHESKLAHDGVEGLIGKR